ncbi:hypothetical protein [Pedobacter sp.]
MKKIFLLLATAFIVTACNEQETSLKVKKTNERLELSAVYPKNKQAKVEDMLKEIFKGKDSLLLTNDLTVGKEVKLTNGAVFYVRYHPGKLELEMLLERNKVVGREYFDMLSAHVKTALN